MRYYDDRIQSIPKMFLHKNGWDEISNLIVPLFSITNVFLLRSHEIFKIIFRTLHIVCVSVFVALVYMQIVDCPC